MKRSIFKKPLILLLLVCIGYIIVFSAHAYTLKQTVYGDGAYYFSWLHTIFIDHDINFSNEYIRFNLTQPFTENGMPINKYAIGPSLLWAPFYLWIHSIVRGDGYTFPYQFVIGFVSVLYVLTGLILLYRLLCTAFKPTIAVLTTILIAVATNLLFYGAIDTVNSHGLSFFAAILFLTFLFQRQSFGVGIALALLALMRPQDVVFALLVLPFLKRNNIFAILSGFILLFCHQLLVWFAFTGNPFISPYFTGGEHYTFLSPHIFSVLFSFENGLLIYTPLFLIAGIGYMRVWKKYERYRLLSIAVVLVSLYLIASWSSWNQGASYSGRMFIALLPLIAFPLASLLTHMTNTIVTLKYLYMIFVLPLGGMNVLLILYFLLTHR
ncbi:MAG: hypothetical protein WAV51_02425 [Microgenomates group bacterium]